MAFSQAVSGLNAAATNLDVIGNNCYWQQYRHLRHLRL